MKTFNLYSDEWDATREREGWGARGTLVGQRIGGELIGATMSEVEPGRGVLPLGARGARRLRRVAALVNDPTARRALLCVDRAAR